MSAAPPDTGQPETGQDGANAHKSASNEARDQSTVGMQAGVVFGDVHLYDVPEGESPRGKYRVALNCLSGNMPRRAEQLIQEVVEKEYVADREAGVTPCHVAYHWALAVLSGRSFDHLSPENLACVQRASQLAVTDDRDAWWKPFTVVFQLVTCLIHQEKIGSADPEAFGIVLQGYHDLHIERRDEIRSHLDMILTGGIQDQLDAIYAKEVRERRTDNDRRNRVPKFFMATPEPPRRKEIPVPRLGAADWTAAVGGSLIALLGLVWAFTLMWGRHWIAVASVTAILILACYAIDRCGLSWLAAQGRLADRRRDRGLHQGSIRYSAAGPEPPPRLPAEGEEDETDEDRKDRLKRRQFRSQLRMHVEYSFGDKAPDQVRKRDRWRKDTVWIRKALIARILSLYDDPPTEPGGTDWIVDMCARSTRKKWDHGQLFDDDDENLSPSSADGFLFAAGVVAAAAAIIVALVDSFQASIGWSVAILALWILGAGLIAGSGADVYLVSRRRLPADQAASDRLLEEEQEEFERYGEKLRDRPTDLEMARWLEYDKIYVKNLALNLYGLTNRDIVAHAVLAESGYARLRARVANGPWRYSRYSVSLYLLTAGGMRRVTANLDFGTGAVSNQQRYNFRFDAITAIKVTELGIRFDDGRRKIIALEDGDHRKENKDKALQSLILAQGFYLSLANGEFIWVAVENFDDGLLDRVREDPERLFELALDTSGVAAALRVLEAVAAEGREWIEHERLRRSRRIQDFQRTMEPFGMLTSPRPEPVAEAVAIEPDRSGSPYTIVLWDGPAPSGPADAYALYERFVSYQQSVVEIPSPQILGYLDELLRKWPCVRQGEQHERRDSPIVYQAVGHVLSCSLAPDVRGRLVPVCVRLAELFSLVCYDPQARRVLHAGG
jgi:hypothetical protein